MELDAQRNLNQDVPSPVNVFWIRVWEIVNSQWDKVFAKFVAFLHLSLGGTIFRMICSRGIDEDFNAIDISHVLSYVSLPSIGSLYSATLERSTQWQNASKPGRQWGALWLECSKKCPLTFLLRHSEFLASGWMFLDSMYTSVLGLKLKIVENCVVI